jgi:hypothetical protein
LHVYRLLPRAVLESKEVSPEPSPLHGVQFCALSDVEQVASEAKCSPS